MKLFAWAIIGFRKLEDGNVSYGQYVTGQKHRTLKRCNRTLTRQ